MAIAMFVSRSGPMVPTHAVGFLNCVCVVKASANSAQRSCFALSERVKNCPNRNLEVPRTSVITFVDRALVQANAFLCPYEIYIDLRDFNNYHHPIDIYSNRNPCRFWLKSPLIIPILVIYNGSEFYEIVHGFINSYNKLNTGRIPFCRCIVCRCPILMKWRKNTSIRHLKGSN